MQAHCLRICAVALLLLSGCTATELEIDKMQGTSFPPQQQSLGGQNHTLPSIYARAGKLLIVDEDQTNIAPLKGTSGAQQNCITNAELDSVEAGNRSSQVGAASFACGFNRAYTCTRYHVYAIVVNHFATSNGSCATGVLGRMWATDTRQAFAIFHRHSTIQTDTAKYLRTTAHELGHAFNLFHSDGDGSTTIMNQTKDVGDSFSYDFTSQSRDHLDNSPTDCVFPGLGSFTLDCR